MKNTENTRALMNKYIQTSKNNNSLDTSLDDAGKADILHNINQYLEKHFSSVDDNSLEKPYKVEIDKPSPVSKKIDNFNTNAIELEYILGRIHSLERELHKSVDTLDMDEIEEKYIH